MVERTQAWTLHIGECKQLMLSHESLERQIASLLLTNGGITCNLSDEDFLFYRQLALRRDLVRHRIDASLYCLLTD